MGWIGWVAPRSESLPPITPATCRKPRAEAERLITQEGVVAIIGSYQSATAAVIGQVTERRGIPFISADNSSPALTRHGLKWFFRTGPHDEMFSESMFNFYHDIGAKTGRTVRSTALFYEDSIFGNDSSAVQRRLSAAAVDPRRGRHQISRERAIAGCGGIADPR